jgi:hypothetical protein
MRVYTRNKIAHLTRVRGYSARAPATRARHAYRLK